MDWVTEHQKYEEKEEDYFGDVGESERKGGSKKLIKKPSNLLKYFYFYILV